MNANHADNDYREPDEIMIPSKDGFIVILTNSIRAQESPVETPKGFLNLWRSHQFKHILQFTLMLAAMTGLMTYIGLAVGGLAGLFLVGIIGGISLLMSKSSIDPLKANRKRSAFDANWDL